MCNVPSTSACRFTLHRIIDRTCHLQGKNQNRIHPLFGSMRPPLPHLLHSPLTLLVSSIVLPLHSRCLASPLSGAVLPHTHDSTIHLTFLVSSLQPPSPPFANITKLLHPWLACLANVLPVQQANESSTLDLPCTGGCPQAIIGHAMLRCVTGIIIQCH